MKNGFTLSEVLITLVIIGIVAAITVPVIAANYQKEALKSAFIKTYSELNNIAKKFYSDNGVSFSEYCSAYGTCLNVFLQYINRGGAASKMNWSTQEEDYDLDYSLKLLSGKQLGKRVVESNTICDDSNFYSDISGKLYRFNNLPGTNKNGPLVCVDTNGLKGPNKYGHDYFVFVFTIDGAVIPMGMEHPNNETTTSLTYNGFVKGKQYCSKTASQAVNNAACAYYALVDKNPDDESKSYWKDFI